MDKRVRVVVGMSAVAVLIICVIISFIACSVSFHESIELDGGGWQLEYQFQELNRRTHVFWSGETPDKLPKELREVVYQKLEIAFEKSNLNFIKSLEEYIELMYSGISEYRFVIDDEIYVLYNSDYADDYYVYRERDNNLMITISKSSVNSLFLKDSSLLYSTKNEHKKTNVLTGETYDIPKKEYEDEYFKLVFKPSNLKDGKKIVKDFPTQSKNISPNPTDQDSNNRWRSFFLHGADYFIVADGMLCHYDLATDTYKRIARLGREPRACFLHDDYIYYIYGTEGWHLGDMFKAHNPPTRKKVAYARISINTLENQIIKKADYFNLYNSY